MKRKLNLVTLFITIILVSLVLTGCSSNSTTQTTSSPTTTTQPNTPTPTTITVTDMAGRTVVVPTNIKKIATFGSIGVLNTFVETMGYGDKIYNQMSPSFTKTDQWKYQYVFAPQIAKGPVFQNANGDIQIEAVLQAAPDLCLCMDKTTVTTLESKGLCVVYLEWKQTDDVNKCITLLGQVLGKPDIAKDYLDYFNKMVDKATKLSAKIADKDKKKVLYGQITTFTQPHRIAEWWIPMAGGISCTADGHPESGESYVYTLEDLLKWNPDVMLAMNVVVAADIQKDTRLNQVSAIMNNKIYCIPTVAHVWGNRTTEQPLTVMWLMNKLYPDIMTNSMLAEEIYYFYHHFFHNDLTDTQIAEIIG